jgi:hypothetical protein
MALENPNSDDSLVRSVLGLKAVLATEKLKKQIAEDLAKLKDKAIQGNNNAIYVLHYMAAHATSVLDEVAKTNASLVIPIARKSALWPVLSGPYPKVKATEETFFKQIQLGKEPILFDARETFRRSSTPREAARTLVDIVHQLREVKRAIDLIRTVDDSIADLPASDQFSAEFVLECSLLPEFSKQTVDKWYPLCRKVLMKMTDEQPEKVKALKQIGLYRAKHNFNKDNKINPKTERANIRDGISAQIKRAMKALAKKEN